MSTLPTSDDFDQIAPSTLAEETTATQDPRPPSEIKQPDGSASTSAE